MLFNIRLNFNLKIDTFNSIHSLSSPELDKLSFYLVDCKSLSEPDHFAFDLLP